MLEFRTKADKNGNTKYLVINTNNKTFKCGYFINTLTPIEITKKDIERLRGELLANDFKEIY